MPIIFNKPPTLDKKLSIETGAQDCASDTFFYRKVITSITQVCFDFDLVNLSAENLASTKFGEYTLSLLIEIQNNDGFGKVYIMPKKLSSVLQQKSTFSFGQD
jgi:hypothetical protein